MANRQSQFRQSIPCFARLLEDELVTVEVVPREGKPPQKIYSITDAGRQTSNDWIDQPATSRAPLKAFAMRLILADNFSHAGLIAHLQQRRDQVAAYHAPLQQTTRALCEKTDLGQHLALDYGSALAIAELAWLDSTLNRLCQSCQQPLPVEVVQSDSATPTA